MREFIGDTTHIDGRTIVYKLVTARDYLKYKEKMTDDEIDTFQDEKYEVYTLINQVMALKQSCFLFRRTSHSCQSLSDDLYALKTKLIFELREQYNFKFDDDFVEKF